MEPTSDRDDDEYQCLCDINYITCPSTLFSTILLTIIIDWIWYWLRQIIRHSCDVICRWLLLGKQTAGRLGPAVTWSAAVFSLESRQLADFCQLWRDLPLASPWKADSWPTWPSCDVICRWLLLGKQTAGRLGPAVTWSAAGFSLESKQHGPTWPRIHRTQNNLLQTSAHNSETIRLNWLILSEIISNVHHNEYEFELKIIISKIYPLYPRKSC